MVDPDVILKGEMLEKYTTIFAMSEFAISPAGKDGESSPRSDYMTTGTQNNMKNNNNATILQNKTSDNVCLY